MRIISPFHDYYDGAMALGIDTTVVYRRETRTVDVPPGLLARFRGLPDSARWAGNGDPVMTPLLVVVAGEPHLGFGFAAGQQLPIERCVFGLEPALAAREEAFGDDRHLRRVFPRRDVSEKAVRAAFDAVSRLDLTDLCIAERTPLLLLRYDDRGMRDGYRRYDPVMFVDPVLKDLGFASAIDPYGMFQAIDRFVGGVLPNAGNEMVVVPDSVRSAKKGFDRWSFRRHRDDPR